MARNWPALAGDDQGSLVERSRGSAHARLPTEEEIAAEVRRRPVGAVIADICRDLGIAPGRLDPAFWRELSHAVIASAMVRPRSRRPGEPRMVRGTAAITGGPP
jgi:hypothetical protein